MASEILFHTVNWITTVNELVKLLNKWKQNIRLKFSNHCIIINWPYKLHAHTFIIKGNNKLSLYFYRFWSVKIYICSMESIAFRCYVIQNSLVCASSSLLWIHFRAISTIQICHQDLVLKIRRKKNIYHRIASQHSVMDPK